jgi:hypothetical protein
MQILARNGPAADLFGVPEISRFFGIVVAMYYDDHPPPHFHARYGEYRAILEIDGGLLTGVLPPRALGLVIEWAALHRGELEENWRRARVQQPLNPIAPLE